LGNFIGSEQNATKEEEQGREEGREGRKEKGEKGATADVTFLSPLSFFLLSSSLLQLLSEV